MKDFFLSRIPGTSAWRLRRWSALLPKIESLENEFKSQDDDALRKASLSLKYRARSGEPLSRLLCEAYALVREAARRTIDMRHFDVQVLGGIALAHGAIAEMETGEGKTLTATLPLYLYALAGKGAHLATVNDYLAARDAQWMGPIYQALAMSVGVIQSQQPPDHRRRAYSCDITYGTAKEFGFDFLRDRLLLRRQSELQSEPLAASATRGAQPLQRPFFFALVDEADSVLIDEARTPLIIASLDEKMREQVLACYRWSAALAPQFDEDEHYEYKADKREVELNGDGRALLRSLSNAEQVRAVGFADLYQFIERAIKVRRDFLRDRQYVVQMSPETGRDEIVIVDEFTGRIAEGRKWRDGIHQAIEAKEGIDVTVPTGQAARITVQDLFLRYRHLAGMTGTARTAAREFRKVYKLRVATIPTNKPVNRRRLPERVFATSEAKWAAIVDEVRELYEQDRPVLIGTRSIDKSELLSHLFQQAGIEHRVLNARQIAAEAEIVARAGEPGHVTVATNMAGRGTDIKLGEGVAERGGLHVICTELHEAARVDRQLAGRCGRQGDPGTFRQFLALDDEILAAGFGPKKAERLKSGGATKTELPNRLFGMFRRAQRAVERKYLRARMLLLHQEKQRKKIHREMGQDPYLDAPE